jgi:hypothetical protein
MNLKRLTQSELIALKAEKQQVAQSCLNGAQDIESADLYLESYTKIQKEISEISLLIDRA